MTGVVNRRAQSGAWSGFEAAHIFPLESESWWLQHNYGRWIRDVTPGVSRISSRQNGFILQSNIHQDFDNYLVSVNPDVSLFCDVHPSEELSTSHTNCSSSLGRGNWGPEDTTASSSSRFGGG